MSKPVSAVTRSLETPLHWRESLETEPESVTERKIKLARKLGVPAILFTNNPVKERVRDLREIEALRQQGSTDILYLALQQGGSWLAGRLYGGIARATNGRVFEDTYGIKVHSASRTFPGNGVEVSKPLHKDTRIYDRHVTFIDTAVRHGSTLRYLAEHFNDPTWTVHHAHGGTPESISAIAMTTREGVDLTEFPIDVSVGCITPPGVRTAGCGADDFDERLRHDGAISLALYQQRGTEEQVASILECLGERAVLGIDDIQFVDPIR